MIPNIHKDKPGIYFAHQFVVKQLHNSVKFLLPNRAELIDMSELRQAHVDMARLPYPVVALEAHGGGRMAAAEKKVRVYAHLGALRCA